MRTGNSFLDGLIQFLYWVIKISWDFVIWSITLPFKYKERIAYLKESFRDTYAEAHISRTLFNMHDLDGVVYVSEKLYSEKELKWNYLPEVPEWADPDHDGFVSFIDVAYDKYRVVYADQETTSQLREAYSNGFGPKGIYSYNTSVIADIMERQSKGYAKDKIKLTRRIPTIIGVGLFGLLLAFMAFSMLMGSSVGAQFGIGSKIIMGIIVIGSFPGIPYFEYKYGIIQEYNLDPAVCIHNEGKRNEEGNSI